MHPAAAIATSTGRQNLRPAPWLARGRVGNSFSRFAGGRGVARGGAEAAHEPRGESHSAADTHKENGSALGRGGPDQAVETPAHGFTGRGRTRRTSQPLQGWRQLPEAWCCARRGVQGQGEEREATRLAQRAARPAFSPQPSAQEAEGVHPVDDARALLLGRGNPPPRALARPRTRTPEVHPHLHVRTGGGRDVLPRQRLPGPGPGSAPGRGAGGSTAGFPMSSNPRVRPCSRTMRSSTASSLSKRSASARSARGDVPGATSSR